jgi:predicted transport protein
MVSAGKKAAITRATGSYNFEQHIQGKPEKIVNLVMLIQEFILGIDASIEQAPKKFYVAYKTSQNIVCLEVQHRIVRLFLKLKPSEVSNPPPIYRDVTNIGHFGTGDAEFSCTTVKEFELVKPYIEQAYRKVGG